MAERLDSKDCIQLSARDYSCEGCPVYMLAQKTLTVSPLNDTVVAELANTRCPQGTRMNIEGLGLNSLPVETPRLKRSGGFVRY